MQRENTFAEIPSGIILQFGGKTHLNLDLHIEQYLNDFNPMDASGEGLVQIRGTSSASIDVVEDREKLNGMLNELKIKQSQGGIVKSDGDALAIARRVGSLVIMSPSYILGGPAMEIVCND